MRRLLFALSILFGSRAHAAPEGRVVSLKLRTSSFDPRIEKPSASERARMRGHDTRLQRWWTRLKPELWCYPNAWFCKDADAITLERGVTGLGLTGTSGRSGLTTFLSCINAPGPDGTNVGCGV